MKKLSLILLIFLLCCSSSKDFDQIPTPIGGEEQVRSVLLKELGGDYYSLVGKR